jgi:hypothetical protein
LNSETELRPTDLANKKTDEADHNTKSLEQLLADFRKVRTQTIGMIEKLDEEIIFRSALHPRLKTPMRTMDSFFLFSSMGQSENNFTSKRPNNRF